MQSFSTLFPTANVSANLDSMFVNTNSYGLRSVVNVISHFDRVIITSFIFQKIVLKLCLRASTIIAKISSRNSLRPVILQENGVIVNQTVIGKQALLL